MSRHEVLAAPFKESRMLKERERQALSSIRDEIDHQLLNLSRSSWRGTLGEVADALRDELSSHPEPVEPALEDDEARIALEPHAR